MKIIIEQITSEHHGDWHDPLLKWVVKGPGAEVQKFATKAAAQEYKRCRKVASDWFEASNMFAKG